MSRRTHKKSRSGCLRCKRRHLKCDETRPYCVNCSVANLQCEYMTSGASIHQEHVGSARLADVDHIADPTSALTATSTLNSPNQHTSVGHTLAALTPSSRALYGTDPVLNLSHMELLHHFCTATYKTFTPEPAQQEIWQTVVVRKGLLFPFLMHEILAISALHLAYLVPQQQSHYSTKATEFQTYALDGFNKVQATVDESSCGAILIFSSLLAFHVLADRSRTQHASSNEYLDHVISCLNLMSSVRKVAISGWFAQMKESDLKPLLHVEEHLSPYDNIPGECKNLGNLPRSSDLSPTSIVAYDVAIERIQWMFALSDVPSTTHSTIRWLLAWPIQLSDDYSKLLNERRPEALIILAYYGVLLHFYRDSWAIGDAGALLVRAINAHVGSYWENWMAWPISVIGISP